MKKIFSLLLTVILVFSVVSCNSSSNFGTLEDDTSEKTNTSAQKNDSVTEAKTEVETEVETDAEPQAALIYKRFDDGTCLVTGIGTGDQTNVVVPKVSPDGDTVIGIANHAFFMNQNVTRVVLPSSIKVIEEGAFQKCTSLKSINFPDGIVRIERVAFQDCKQLESVSLPKSLEVVGDMAFDDCTSIKSISILCSSLHYGSVFSNNPNVEYIVIPFSCVYSLYNTGKALRNIFVFDVEFDEYSFRDSDLFQAEIAETIDISPSIVISFISDYKPDEYTYGNFWRYVYGVPTLWES